MRTRMILISIALLMLPVCLWANRPDASAAMDGYLNEEGRGSFLLDMARPAIALIGKQPDSFIQSLGSPERVEPLRGEHPALDDILISYPGGLYLYLYNNRVWQVQVTPAYPLSSPLRFGMDREELFELVGEPFFRDEESAVYLFPEYRYPLRLRLYFSDEGLCDLYIYRSDL